MFSGCVIYYIIFQYNHRNTLQHTAMSLWNSMDSAAAGDPSARSQGATQEIQAIPDCPLHRRMARTLWRRATSWSAPPPQWRLREDLQNIHQSSTLSNIVHHYSTVFNSLVRCKVFLRKKNKKPRRQSGPKEKQDRVDQQRMEEKISKWMMMKDEWWMSLRMRND